MTIMLRAVSTSKATRAVVGLFSLVVLGCGGLDSSVAPPPPPPLIPPHLTIDVRGMTVDMKVAEPYPVVSIRSALPNAVAILDGDVVAPKTRRVFRPVVLR